MNITSTGYDYTSLLSAYAAQKRTTQSTTTETSQSKTSQAVDALMKKLAPLDMGSSIMSLSARGQKVKDSIQRPEPLTDEMKAAMDQVRSDFESIASTDMDAVSSEDAKTLLSKLVSDMGSLPANASVSNTAASSSAVDFSSLTDTEVKDMLQKIQDQLANGAGEPPPPPQGMTWGFDASQLLGDSTTEDSTLRSTNSSEMAQQLIDLLTESYDSSSETGSDYAAKLKESIADMLEKQKSGMDDFASTLYSQLDAWSNTTT